MKKKLLNLLRSVGLYMVHWLVQKPDMEYVFLEANPSGKFVFIENTQSIHLHSYRLLVHPQKLIIAIRIDRV